MKPIVYCRKSTDEKDKQQQSLTFQLSWCENFLSQKWLDAVDTIVVSESAKDVWRSWFMRVMEYIEKGEADTIVCMYIDRLSRNPRDSGRVQDLLQKWKISQIITSTRIFTQEDSWILFSVESWFANEYILKIKKGIRDWYQQLMKEWRYYSHAPIWYLNDKLTHTIIVDPERSFYIPRLFELRLEGLSVKAIRDILHAEGFRSKKWKRVSVPCLERALKNPFYYGWIEYEWEMFEKWIMYKWAHQPLISKELFDKVQKINRWVIYVHNRHISYLKWKVFLLDSEKPLCTSIKKKPSWKEYIFHHLHTKDWNFRYNEKKIIKYFDDQIKNYEIPEEYQPIVKNELIKVYKWNYEINQQEISNLRREKTNAEITLSWYFDMRANKEMSWEDFVKKQNEMKLKIETLDSSIKKIQAKNDEILRNFNILVELLFTSIFERKTYDDKKKGYIISLICVELKIDKNKRLHIEEKPLFEDLYNLKNHLWSGERGLNSYTQGLKP